MKVKENLIIIILLSSILVVLSLTLISINNNKDVGRYVPFNEGYLIVDTKTGDIYMVKTLGLNEIKNDDKRIEVIENYKKFEKQKEKK